ncbi:MAG: class I tRNA ligase family protein, partial [Deltaproteobacteria bacterium]|nr:class I tRNA ligase family protein [Deltaproteobacteria bacterium]
VEWIPHWGKERIYNMIENRPDWCVSRQRAWGVPITVFYCDKCEELYISQEIIDLVCSAFEEHGADIWFEKDANEFLPKGAVCEKCQNTSFVKETDILDVWFDSGVSHAAVLEQRSYLKWPADLYLEGSDQHRGWFHSSILTAVGTREAAPYNAVLTHGYVVDAQGKKMSKSLGNIVAPSEVIDKYGAEILRLWVSASDYRDDIRISDKFLKQLSDAYRRIRNTCRFLLGNLSDFNPEKNLVPYESMPDIDRFAMHRLSELIEKTRKAYDTYEFHLVYHALYNYCTLDLSAFYLDILKDRLYTSPPNSVERRCAQTVMYNMLDSMVRLMAPILSFTAEEIWRFMPEKKEKAESVHLASLPEVKENIKDEKLAEKWERLLAIRSEVTKALEKARAEKHIGHPLDAAVTISCSKENHDILSQYADDLKSIFIVSKASLATGKKLIDAYESQEIKGLSVKVEVAEGDKCMRCWIHEPSVGESPDHPAICSRCRQVLDRIAREEPV